MREIVTIKHSSYKELGVRGHKIKIDNVIIVEVDSLAEAHGYIKIAYANLEAEGQFVEKILITRVSDIGLGSYT